MPPASLPWGVLSLTDDLVGASSEPALAALLLGTVAQAGERGVVLRLGVDGELEASALSTSELVSVVGNLIDSGLDAAAGGASPARVSVRLTIDRATGVIGLAVVRDALARRGGVVEVVSSGVKVTRFVARWPLAKGDPT